MKISYDPVKIAPLSRVGSFTQMLVHHPDLPVKSIPELIAHQANRQAFICQRECVRGRGRRDAQALGRAGRVMSLRALPGAQ
jgi:tripartite-type tricarboxylate transporter receptor subunit TctC